MLTIRSQESAEHVQRLASYVSEKIDTLKAKNLSAAVDERLKTLLLALNIADDYFKAKDQLHGLEVLNHSLTAQTAKLEKENAVLKKHAEALEAKLVKVTGEFEEFLHHFDNPEAAPPKQEHIVPLPKIDTRKAAN